MVQDVGTNEPIPLWKKETEEELVSSQPMRYSIKLKIDTIIITATTPSSTGVRLKTGEIFFELANQNPQLPVIQPHYPSSKMYGSAGLVLNLSLGQFNSKPFPGAEDQDLSVFANFCTSLSMRNAAHEDRFDTDYKVCFPTYCKVFKGGFAGSFWKARYEHIQFTNSVSLILLLIIVLEPSCRILLS